MNHNQFIGIVLKAPSHQVPYESTCDKIIEVDFPVFLLFKLLSCYLIHMDFHFLLFISIRFVSFWGLGRKSLFISALS